jgi:hypothetical protein
VLARGRSCDGGSFEGGIASNVPVQKKEKNIELNLHIFWFKEGHASQLWEFFI